MSSHADTIRAAITLTTSEHGSEAHDALDALEAENQRLREALEQIKRRPIGAYEIATAALLAAVVEE